MFHGHLDCFQKPLFGGRSITRLGDHGTLKCHNHALIHCIYHVSGPCMNRDSLEEHWLRGQS